MSFTSAENFARRHGGVVAIEQFCKLLNNGESLETIGQIFHFSTVQASRVAKNLFDVVYVPKRGTIEYIEFQKQYLQRELNEREEFIQNSAQFLQYLPGKKDASGT